MGYSIKVSGSDIYVAGYIEHISNNGNTLQAVYWKNGVQTILTDISLAADAFDIVINNNDIYVSGFVRGSFNQPAYWKNGVQTTLDVTNAGTYGRSIVSSIAVDNNDVYVVSGYPRYWKNGVPFQLAKDGGATGIYVVPN